MSNPEIDNLSLQLEIPVESMSDGATVPIEDILERYPNPKGIDLVDVGSGSSKKTTDLQKKGFNITSIDILPEAIKIAQNQGFDGKLIDITSPSSTSDNGKLKEMVEAYDLVLLQGLLVNLVENTGEPKWKKGLEVCQMMLKPNGHMFGAVVIRQDKIDMFQNNLPNHFDWESHSQAWTKRYQHNQKLDLPKGTVMVGKPGESKHLEWGNTESLFALKKEGHLERLVHHIDYVELIQVLEMIDHSDFTWKTSLFPSRDLGKHYVGIVFCLQK